MNEKEVKRGQIYMAILDPVFGREMGGFKPPGTRLVGEWPSLQYQDGHYCPRNLHAGKVPQHR